MANENLPELDGPPQPITVPLDFIDTIRQQPIQPSIDPAVYADNLAAQNAQAHLPDFFKQSMDEMAARHAQDQADQDAQAAQAEAQRQADAANQATNEAADQLATQVAAQQVSDQAAAAQASLPGNSPDASQVNTQGVPYYLQKPDDAAAPAAPADGMNPPVTESDLTDTTRLADPNLDPNERAKILAQSNALQSEKDFAASHPDYTPETYHMNDHSGFSDIPSEVSGALGKITEPIAKVSEDAIKDSPAGIIANYEVNHLPGSLPIAGHDLPVTDIAQGVLKSAEQAPGFIGADILTGGALTPVFGVQAVSSLTSIAQQYNSGKLSGFDAIKQALMVAPNLAPFLLHGSGKLADFSKTEDGQLAIKEAQSEGASAATGEGNQSGTTNIADTQGATATGGAEGAAKGPDDITYNLPPEDMAAVDARVGAKPGQPVPPIESTRSIIPGQIGDIQALQAEMRSITNPAERARFAQENGLSVGTHEQLAIDRGEVAPANVSEIRPGATAAGITEVPQTPLDEKLGRHTLTTPNGDRLEWRETADGGHINDVTVQAEGQGTGTALLERARADIAKLHPDGVITGDLNSEGGAKLFGKQPGVTFRDRMGNILNSEAGAISAGKGEGPTAELPVRGTQPVVEGAGSTSLPPDSSLPVPKVNSGEQGALRVGRKSTLPGGPDTITAPEIPTEMKGTQKIVRYIVRALGGEFDPAAIREMKTTAARGYQAAMQDAQQYKLRLSEAVKKVDEPYLDPSADPRKQSAYAKMNKTEKMMAAAMYPDDFIVTPAAQAVIDDMNAKRDWMVEEGKKVGIEYGDMKESKPGVGGGDTLEYGTEPLDSDMKGRVVRVEGDPNPGRITSVNENNQTAQVRITDPTTGEGRSMTVPVSNLAVFAEGATGTSDPVWIPRKGNTYTNAQGVEVPFDTVSSSMKGRTAGDIWDYVLAGNHVVDDLGLNMGAALEDTASARLTNEIREGYKRLKDQGGNTGPATMYARPGTPKAEGYVEVPGLSDDRNVHNGKMTLAQKGIVAESARSAFSKGLPDVQRTITQPARFIRAVNFSLGPFHAIYENVALATDNIKALPKTLGEEFLGTFDESKRADMIAQENPNIMLSQQLGAQINFGGDLRGANRAEISAVQGIPEIENVIDKVPVVGAISKANRDWMFNWIVPWVQTRMGMTRLTDWMVKNPSLVPADYAEVMAKQDPAAIRDMLDANPQFKKAGEDIMAHTNKVTGFTENTLGRAEKEVQGAVLSTPTITRAIIANARDAFSAPGSARGTMGRQYWRNAIAGASTAAIGGTLLAYGGDYEKAKRDGYLDPTSSKFILNPQSGANFMSVVTPSGTRYRVIPSPILSPITALFKGAATAGTTAAQGGTPREIFSSGLGDEAVAGRDFVTNRLAAPERFAKEYAEQQKQGNSQLSSLKESALTSGESDVPLPTGPLAKAILGGGFPDRGTIEKGGLSLIGGAQYGPTASTQLLNYRNTLTNPDGTPRFPTTALGDAAFNNFINSDPQGQSLRDAAEAARTGTSAQMTAIQQDTRTRIGTEQAKFNAAPLGPDKYKNFRDSITQIRAENGQKAADLALSNIAPGDPDHQLLASWSDTFKQARDPQTGKLDGNILDPLQEQWKADHPGDYTRLIEPIYVLGAKSPTEEQLRTDRNTIADSGWWKLGQQSWGTIKDAVGSDLGLDKYSSFVDYAQAKLAEDTQFFLDKGYDEATATSLSSILWTKDPVAKVYSKIKNQNQLLLQVDHPDIISLLGKWGYSTTNPKEAALLMSISPSTSP